MKLPTRTAMFEEAAARSGTYHLLARCWIRELDLAFLRRLRSPPLSDAFAAAGGVLPTDEGQQTVERLAIDYCRLLVGPTDHLPPFQSVWQSGQFQGGPATSMKSYVEVVGYDTSRLPAGMMLDHLGVQLDVMGRILIEIARTWEQGRSDATLRPAARPHGDWQPECGRLEALSELVDAYCSHHLRWPADMLEAAANRAETDFYRSVISLTRTFLHAETQT